jgi:two-component system, LuxR family, sensor kinase FixL
MAVLAENPLRSVQGGHRLPRASREPAPDTITCNRAERMEEMPTDLLHELNQPLAAIANYARAGAVLLATDPADLADVRAALEQISAQALRAGRIIQRLRSLSHNRLSDG